MQKLISGLSQFQKSDYQHKQSLFAELAHGQSPHTLFITCSDSRIDPNLITRSDPGDIFVLRNAGNLIPRKGQASGEAATIEYAIKALKVQDIVVCGHSGCGAMNAVLQAGSCDELPAVAAWLQNTDGLTQRTLQRNGEQSPERMLELVIQENVRMQLENLEAMRCVADALSSDQVQLHGWAYDIGSGNVEMLDREQDAFVPLSEATFGEIDGSTSGYA